MVPKSILLLYSLMVQGIELDQLYGARFVLILKPEILCDCGNKNTRPVVTASHQSNSNILIPAQSECFLHICLTLTIPFKYFFEKERQSEKVCVGFLYEK